MTTGVERRRAPRYSVFLPVCMPTSGTGEIFGVTRDVSSGGLFFYTELEYLEAGNRIEFVFQFPTQVGEKEKKSLGIMKRRWHGKAGRHEVHVLQTIYLGSRLNR